MCPERVLFIGARERDLQAAKALGLEVIYIQKKSLFRSSHLPYADSTVLIDYEDDTVLLPLVKGLQEARPFQQVISLTESGLVPAARVRDELGLPGTSPETTRLLKDKWAMRKRLNELGISPVLADVGFSRVHLENFVKRSGGRVIVKPVDSTGSFGVFAVDSLNQVGSVWEELEQLEIASFIMEEYIDGPEISVEAFSFHGRHVVISLTDKMILPNFVEIGHCVPSRIDGSLRQEVIDLVTVFLDAVGLKDGPSHTEIKLTPKGPRIVESHNRVGGDKINDLIKITYGVDMISLSLAWAFGLTAPVEVGEPAGGAAVRFFAPTPGIVKEVTGVEEVRGRPEVVELHLDVQVGGEVKTVRRSGDRSGYIIVQGRDASHAQALCQQFAEDVHVVTGECPHRA